MTTAPKVGVTIETTPPSTMRVSTHAKATVIHLMMRISIIRGHYGFPHGYTGGWEPHGPPPMFNPRDWEAGPSGS